MTYHCRYQHKKQTLYDLDDIERIGLLKRKGNSITFSRSSVHNDFTDNDYLIHNGEGIQCSHCMILMK